jgi:hypothetical protein
LNDEKPVEQTPEKTFAGFVAAAMDFLNAQGPQAAVVIVVEGPRGFQTFRNQQSLPWLLGACTCAMEMFKDLARQAQAANQGTVDQVAKEEEDRMAAAVEQTKKGKLN